MIQGNIIYAAATREKVITVSSQIKNLNAKGSFKIHETKN
jgi:hypothetical protein